MLVFSDLLGRVTRLGLVGALFVALLGPEALAQRGGDNDNDQPPPGLPGVRVFEEEADRQPPPEDRRGPGFTLDTRRTRREAQAAEKREEAIQTLLEMLQIADPTDQDFPPILVKLADQYWQKSEDFFELSQAESLLQQIFDAEEAANAEQLANLRNQQNALIQQQSVWRQKAIDTYRQIERDHPNFKDLDQVLYSIGYHATVMGQLEMGYQYYAKLVLQRPTSDLIPDTYLNIGDYFFQRNDFQQALAFYAKVEQFGRTRVRGYAIYKSGWCWFNLGDKAKAMNRFYDTVKWTREAEAEGNAAAIDLRGEAQNDMVRAYSFIGAPQKAVGFFKRIAPEIYIKLCEKLAVIYTNDANYGSSNRLYRALITEIGDDYRVLVYQREIVYNTFKSGEKERMQDEVGKMTEALTRYLERLPTEFRTAEMKELELLLRIISTDYHREAEKTLSKPEQLLALFVYEQYLKWFPDAEDYYTMNFNVAILAYQMQEFERAAVLFEKVIELQPDGPFTAHAAHTSLLSYYKLVNLEASEVKEEDLDEEYKPLEIPGNEKLLVVACERYIRLAPEGADDVAEAMFAAGKVYYDYNHFDKAIALFAKLYEGFPAFSQMQVVARLLLSVFNVTNDIDNLNKWADTFSGDANITGGELGPVIKEIQASRDFNKCRQLEFNEQFGESGDCFMAYFTNFPQSKYGDKALNNAAIMYRNARMIEKALVASERLYNERQDSPIAPQALFNIGSIYKAIAVYSEAAYYYELYAKNHPKHNVRYLEKALARAATYRRALGQYDKAIESYVNYYKLFPTSEKAPLVFFEIGLIYESQENWRGVVRHFKRYLRNYAETAPKGHVITAHTKMGVAYWNSRGKRRQAMEAFGEALEIFTQMRAAAGEAEVEISAMGVDAVAEAKFYEGEVVLENMKAVRLQLPQARFTERLQQKIALIKEATERMQEVAQFGRPHWEIAAFNRIGQAYQNLADAIENAPLPRRLNEEARYLLQEDFTRKANEVRSQAVQAYRICLERAIEKQWFNEYSDNAEQNLAKLDLEYKFTRELRPQPNFYRPNATVPAFLAGTGEANKAGVEAAGKIEDWENDSAGVEKVLGLFRNAASGEEKALGLYNMALVYAHQRNWEQALTHFQEAAQADAQMANAHAMVGAALGRLTRTGGEVYFQAALKLERFNSIAHNVASVAAQAGSNWTESTKASRQALIGNAESLNAYQNLARVYYMTGQFDMARLVCEQALEFDEDNAALNNLLGLTLLKQDDVRGALRTFQKAVGGDPSSVEARLNLASTVLNYSDFAQAEAQYSAVLKLEPQNVNATMGRAVAHRGLKRWPEAKEGYQAVIAAQPNNADARYNLCLLGYYEEKYREALAACQEFMTLASADHPKRKEVQERVEGLQNTIEFMEEGAQDGGTEPGTETDGEPPADGEAQPPADGEAQPPAEGEGTPPAEGQGTPAEGEATPPAEGEAAPAATPDGDETAPDDADD